MRFYDINPSGWKFDQAKTLCAGKNQWFFKVHSGGYLQNLVVLVDNFGDDHHKSILPISKATPDQSALHLDRACT